MQLWIQSLLTHFDFFDLLHVLFLGLVGMFLSKLEQSDDDDDDEKFNTPKSSMRSSRSRAARGSVTFAEGTKFGGNVVQHLSDFSVSSRSHRLV